MLMALGQCCGLFSFRMIVLLADDHAAEKAIRKAMDEVNHRILYLFIFELILNICMS
jgi:amino acid permease